MHKSDHSYSSFTDDCNNARALRFDNTRYDFFVGILLACTVVAIFTTNSDAHTCASEAALHSPIHPYSRKWAQKLRATSSFTWPTCNTLTPLSHNPVVQPLLEECEILPKVVVTGLQPLKEQRHIEERRVPYECFLGKPRWQVVGKADS